MIKRFKLIDEINRYLGSCKNKGEVKDYRIVYNANGIISTYVISDESIEISKWIHNTEILDENNISCNEYQNEKELYEPIFSNPDSIILSPARRHLANLFDSPKRIDSRVPVISFYSYKGGVGRSTALASCAFYLSYHHQKKIAILDCDFEAPGFTNFYVEDYESPMYKEGLIEYFNDNLLDDSSLAPYYWSPSKKYTGDGEIFVFPSGNLDDTELEKDSFGSNLAHYLNGLSFLDTMSRDALVEKFEFLIRKINNELKPDAILIDSRTGFNDIFGVSALRLSNLVVGFFSDNIQTQPGLHFFLDLLRKEDSPSLICVNSLIPATGKKSKFRTFSENVDDYLTRISLEDREYYIEKSFVSLHPVLNTIGMPDEDPEDFIGLITRKEHTDYNDLFEKINERIDYLSTKTLELETSIVSLKEKSQNDSRASILKKRILKNLREKIPKLYAEQIKDFEEEYQANRYFYRNCMIDLFNPDKILILGNKGTGKSYIYRSLNNKNIVNELRRKAKKESLDCLFIPMITDEKRFDTIKLDDNIQNPALYFERFWTTYIWNSIIQEKPYGYSSNISFEPIRNDTATAVRLKNIISDELQLIKIEADLEKLDQWLISQNRQIIIIFDELDKVVKPILWSERITPLINLFRNKRFAAIQPKLFLRSDLFEKITNINNKMDLNNRSISIEWTRQELFAYFFKLVLSHSSHDFFEIMKLYKVYPNNYINKVIDSIKHNDNQPQLDDYTLQHLCSTFFGRYVDSKGSERLGETYDWFFKNLRNANNTISLRPFIDLIRMALDLAQNKDDSENPLLPQEYYMAGDIRSKSVERHFMDLASEEGNEDLIPIFEYIRDKASKKYKKENLTQQELFIVLDNIIAEGKISEVNRNRDNLISLLTVNGIIRSRIVRRYGNQVFRNFQFAFLYKYYLGLKSNKI